jgi:hypothetical protein
MRKPGVLLVIQMPQCIRQIPTKMFEYLASGNPVLVLADEASAVWEFAKTYSRCFRLDHTDQAHNRTTMASLIRSWGEGGLRQSRAVEDTGGFTKPAVGREFVRILERAIETRKPDNTR